MVRGAYFEGSKGFRVFWRDGEPTDLSFLVGERDYSVEKVDYPTTFGNTGSATMHGRAWPVVGSIRGRLAALFEGCSLPIRATSLL